MTLYLRDKVRAPAIERLLASGLSPLDSPPSVVLMATLRVRSSYVELSASIAVRHAISPKPRTPQARILASHISSCHADDGEFCMTADTNTHFRLLADRASFPSKPRPCQSPNNPNSHPILQHTLELEIDSQNHFKTPQPFQNQSSAILKSTVYRRPMYLCSHPPRPQAPLHACARMSLLP